GADSFTNRGRWKPRSACPWSRTSTWGPSPTASSEMGRAPAQGRSVGFWLTVGVVGLATLGAALTGMPALAALPILGAGVVAFLLRAPLRIPTLTLLFLGLVLDNPADIGPWKSPLFPLGELLLTQL